MRVHNLHERSLPAPPERVGALLDTLASADDRLWPRDRWPALRFDRPLGPGATGGHGPIRYRVVGYEPGRSLHFRFTWPAGFDGGHRFEVEPGPEGHTRLRHVMEMETRGAARLSWPLLFRPLHDALLEDALDLAERGVGAEPAPRRWSLRVRLLRRLLRPPRRLRPQL